MINADIYLVQSLTLNTGSGRVDSVFVDGVLSVLRNCFRGLLCNGFGCGHSNGPKTDPKKKHTHSLILKYNTDIKMQQKRWKAYFCDIIK